MRSEIDRPQRPFRRRSLGVAGTLLLLALFVSGQAAAHTPTAYVGPTPPPANPNGGTCQLWAELVLVQAAKGVRVHPSLFAPCATSIATPPSGSGNWPVMLAVAQAINHDAGFEPLYPWLTGADGWGHNGKEDLSTIYHSWNWSAALAGIKVARDHGLGESHPLVVNFKSYLLATLARLSLGGTLTEPDKLTYKYGTNGGGTTLVEQPVNTTYTGGFVTHPANRSENDYTAWLSGSYHHYLLSWCLGLSRQLSSQVWPVQMMTDLYGVGYGQSLPADACGITNSQRNAMVAFLGNKSMAGAQTLIGYLAGYNARPGQVFEYKFFDNNNFAITLNGTAHHTKGSVNYIRFKNRSGAGTQSESFIVAPSEYVSDGSASAGCDFYDGSGGLHVSCWTISPSGPTTDYTVGLGTPVFTVRQDQTGWSVAAGGSSCSGDTQGPASVVLTAPTSGAQIEKDAPFTWSVSASGDTARVDLRDGSTVIASDTSAPWGGTVSLSTLGGHTLRARGFDECDNFTTSTGVPVTVYEPTPGCEAPGGQITVPSSAGQVFPRGLVNFQALAYHDDGIENVQFWVQGNRSMTLVATQVFLGAPTSVSASRTWDASGFAAGDYLLIVKADPVCGDAQEIGRVGFILQ